MIKFFPACIKVIQLTTDRIIKVNIRVKLIKRFINERMSIKPAIFFGIPAYSFELSEYYKFERLILNDVHLILSEDISQIILPINLIFNVTQFRILEKIARRRNIESILDMTDVAVLNRLY